ncbi:MAG: hypothetical protein M3R17_11870 [Bacteroidota bacterium]|nr:hypothetical protein [Bacteroidota bacterium]
MSSKRKPVRVAILCRDYMFQAWEAACLREVMTLSNVQIVLLIAEAPANSPATGNKLVNYPYRNFYWRFYDRYRLDIPAYKLVSLKKEFEIVPVISCRPELKGKYSQHLSSEDIEKIKSHQPDVILRFAFNILRGEILTVAKYGVWSFHHADEQIIRGGPAAFWEIYNRVPVTGAILQRLTEKLDAGIILRKGHFPTIFHSYKENLEQLINGTASWMKQALIDVANEQSPAVTGNAIETKAPVYTFPRNFTMARFRNRLLFNKLRFHFRELFKPEQWNIGILDQGTADVLANGISPTIEWLPEPKSNEYYADPFGWKVKDELKIVFEKYRYKNQKGILALSDTKGNMQTLLDAKVHLSYPFVLERSDGEKANRVILPESHAAGNLFCFDSANPKNGKVIIENLPAVDATPVQYKDRWWIFCTKPGPLSNTELFIYHADQFEGPWLPHENNPVKSDVRSSRPGGTPFILNGKLYRPAQDCSVSYGGAIVINEIITLTENSFAEKTIRRIEPQKSWKFNKGLHTFSIAGNNILIDAKRYAFNFDNFGHILTRKIKRIFSK